MKLRLLIPFAIIASAGCLWTPKSYANDPLVRHRRDILGDPTQPISESRWVEPAAPPPPADAAP